MSERAKKLLDRVRRRPSAPRGHSLQPTNAYKIIAVGLYLDQIDYLDTVADALKRTKNEPRNRSGALQWLIEQHMKGQA